MCEPRFFEVSYVINPWMAVNIGKVDKSLATQQWKQLYDTLSRKASIKLLEPVAHLPDLVFTANAGLVAKKQAVIISTFRYPERQAESQHYKKFFEEANYQIKTLASNIIFEGAGDALFDTQGELWFGSGPRSDVAAITEISRVLQVKVNALKLIDPRWYHLDTAFCPLTDGFLIAYKKAFSDGSVIDIQNKFGDKVIWISDEDANNFACNAICIGHDVFLYHASSALKSTLKRYNFSVIEIDVSEFMKSGGSCKCMTLEI